MAGNIVDTYCESILDADLKTATVYLALFTASPTDTGALGNEVSGVDYARIEAVFGNVAASRSIANTTIITFAVAGAGGWGTITHCGIMDGDTEGADNMEWWGVLSPQKVIDEGDQIKVPIGNLTVSFTAT